MIHHLNQILNNNYTVTEKADGQRKLLYINKTGKIHLLNRCKHEGSIHRL